MNVDELAARVIATKRIIKGEVVIYAGNEEYFAIVHNREDCNMNSKGTWMFMGCSMYRIISEHSHFNVCGVG